MNHADGLRLTRIGWSLALPVLLLALLGLISIHAALRNDAPLEVLRAAQAASQPTDAWSRLAAVLAYIGPGTLKQGFFLITGIGLMFLVMRVSYERIGRSAFLIYAVLLVLLALLAADKYTERYAGFSIPGVHESRNIRGWIRLGPMQFQPSEFMKVALVLVLARYLRFRTSYRRLWGLVPPFLLTLVPMFLILLQPDLGTLLMLLPVLFAMIFAAGARLKHLAAIIVLGAATLPLFYLSMKDYQRARIDALFKQNTDDERWQMGPGYQLRQSKIALGTGRFWGEGVGGSPFVQRGLLPEEHNDFIFALVGHQWGFVGCLLVIAAYIVICICGLEVATLTNDPFGRLIAVGVVVMIVVQAMLNMSMVVGLAPITGIPLPMVSQGGSSLWANFIALGLLVDVARRRPMLIANKPFEHDD